MARHHHYYHSPYAAPRRASRWPWLVGLLIVVGFIATGGVLAQDRIRDGVSAIRREIAQNQNPPPTAEVAAVQNQSQNETAVPREVVPGSTAPPPAQSQAPATTAEADQPAAPIETTAGAPEVGGPVATVAPTPAVQATPIPVAEPGDVADTYLRLWSTGDYDGLYDLLSAEAQKSIDRAAFVERYNGIAAKAGLTAIKATVTGEPNLQTEVPIDIEYESGLVGTIVQENAIPLVKENGVWKVKWSPSLIFRDLGDGCVDYLAEEADRGRILDRNGTVLAEDGLISRVGVVPGQIENEKTMLAALSDLTGLDAAEIKAKYQDGDPEWFMQIKDFPEEKGDELLAKVGELPGVSVRNVKARVYPLGAKAAHITGYLSTITEEDIAADTTGTLVPGSLLARSGVEYGANELLTGKPGGKLVVVACDSRGVRATIAERKASPAKDVVLTIDSDLQVAVDAALGNVKGSSVILDPRTGGVLALVSHPTFDPNWFILGFSDKDWKYINDANPRPLLNRATQAGYPTGSIFKAITMAAAMEHLGYDGETEIDCPQEFRLQGSDQVWKDWTVDEELGPQGVLTLHRALVNSCNTVFYQLGEDLDKKGEDLLPDMAKAFGLGAETGLQYFQEVPGVVPDGEWKQSEVGDFWARGDAINLAIGQGYLLATPLQMTTAYTAIANGGALLQPFIVESTVDADGTTTEVGKRKERGKLPLAKATVREIQSALRDQTSTQGFGSFKVFGDYDYPIAGKTGTAQTGAAPVAGKTEKKPHSWFAAFGPYGDTATIASIVMVESVGEGVMFAAPTTRKIYDAYQKTDLADADP